MQGFHRAVPPFTSNLLCHTLPYFSVFVCFFVSFDAKIFHKTHSSRPGASCDPSTRSYLHLQPSLFCLWFCGPAATPQTPATCCRPLLLGGKTFPVCLLGGPVS